jgi:hypothetical protein
MNKRPPRQRHRLIRRDGMVRVFRATLEAVREAQKTGETVDVEMAEVAAHAALIWLKCVVVSHWTRA